ncbi:MAG: DUF1585 domain-containing protein [Pedosphaera sp.]|nr:DUF1585 domain-containing protein [Pedosphaera sp.]
MGRLVWAVAVIKKTPKNARQVNLNQVGLFICSYTQFQASSKVKPYLNASGELPDGRKFANIAEFQTLFATSPRPLLMNLGQQLTIYSTGRPLAFSDRAGVNELVTRTEKQGGGIRTLVHELVQSPLFQVR